MGALKPTPRAKINATAREYADRLPKASETRIVNDEAVASLSVDKILFYRNVRYRVPPVGYHAGLRLQKLYRESQEIIGRAARERGNVDFEKEEATEREIGDLYDRMATEFFSLVRPIRIFHRLFWRWIRNPFLGMTEADVTRLMGFFFTCRMTSTVRGS